MAKLRVLIVCIVFAKYCYSQNITEIGKVPKYWTGYYAPFPNTFISNNHFDISTDKWIYFEVWLKDSIITSSIMLEAINIIKSHSKIFPLYSKTNPYSSVEFFVAANNQPPESESIVLNVYATCSSDSLYLYSENILTFPVKQKGSLYFLEITDKQKFDSLLILHNKSRF